MFQLSFAVLVAHGDFAYRRKEDGIVICPIGCIRP